MNGDAGSPGARYRSLLKLENLPCHFGPMPTPENFAGLPNVLPFELAIDTEIGILRQIPTPELREVLTRTYQQGNVLGTPLMDDEFGGVYAEDFLDFLDRAVIKGRSGLRILEVGAGAGFISYKLRQFGHRVTSIEPGSSYRKYWDHYGIDVINDFFPTPHAPGPFDLILSYAVLEHIEDATGFLRSMSAHLAPGGAIAAAVPNNTDEILAGDPGMLVHEHFYYFMRPAFARLLSSAGLEVSVVEEAPRTRVLFGVALDGSGQREDISCDELEIYDDYGRRFGNFLSAVTEALTENESSGRSLGIYCPARALAVLPHDIKARFFDDAVYNKGNYYPPFLSVIEGRENLSQRPVDEMWIMSRSFSRVIAERIAPMARDTLIRKIEDFAAVPAPDRS